MDETKDQEELKQGCWQKFRFFLRHSFRDVYRHPCHFCLAFCSVFIVVLSTLVVNTVTAQGPIIFVSLAEYATGQIDVWYTSQPRCFQTPCPQGANYWAYDDFIFNYTRVTELYGDTYNLSPRWNQYLYIGVNGNYTSGFYYFYDQEREKEIAIGTSWPYPDLETGECILSSIWSGWQGDGQSF